MSRDKWIWMPHAGHFICSNKCRFHLNTYVKGHIVSTIGELLPERGVREIHASVFDPKWLSHNHTLKGDYFDAAYFKRFGYEEIGCERTYETMVFKAKRSKEVCCPYKIANFTNLDSNSYNDAGEAKKGHYKLCKKWDM